MPSQQEWWPFKRTMMRREVLIVEAFDGTSGFQRGLKQKFVDEAVSHFDPVRFDALKVARIIDGPHYEPGVNLWSIIDGQHRRAMAEELDLSVVPADAYVHDMDYKQRALEFYRLNSARQRMSVADGARALFEGEDDEMCALLYLLERHGFYLSGFKPKNVNGHKPLTATSTLRAAYSTNSNALEDVLYVLEPWRGQMGKRHERLMIGALMIVCRKEGIDLIRLRRVLEQHGATTLTRDAEEAQTRRGGRNITARAMATALVRHYNHGKRTGRLEDEW